MRSEVIRKLDERQGRLYEGPCIPLVLGPHASGPRPIEDAVQDIDELP